MLNNIGLPGLILMLVILTVLIVPFWRLLPKFGISKWVSILAIIPAAPLVLLWVIAFMEPVQGRSSEART
ncbi:hypothetical protein ACEWPM_006345 [Roseovarius sp. S4756]|uniref:hypothetical protein n=1 Tax=Roseovarius maritimus TaxID=3342637 RepID=UPI00372BEA6E